jgi:hypothetical protein
MRSAFGPGMSDEPNNGKMTSEGVLLAILPATGYVTTFLYDWGATQYFRIPYRWITLDVSAMLGVILLVGAYFLVGLDSIFKIARRLNGYPDVTPPLAWSLGVLGLPLLRAFWPNALLVGVSIVFIVEVAYRSRNAYRRRSRGAAPPTVVDASAIPPPIMRSLFAWSLGIALVWFLAVAGVSGYVGAKTKAEFLIVPGTPELAVLATYGDRIVAAPFDRKKRRLEPALRVLLVNEAGILRREVVGPLSVE